MAENDPARLAPGPKSPTIGRFEPGRDVDEVYPPSPGRLPPFPVDLGGVPARRLFFPSTIRRMTVLRRSRGFEPLGSAGVRSLGLSAARAKDLELQAAWRHVAGPAIARRAKAVALRRGVLTLSISEPAWRKVLEGLLPELGARFARHHPALGVTRFQLTDGPG